MFNVNQSRPHLILPALLLAGGLAQAATPEESGIADEVYACVAQVRDQIDYHDASRVRHDVTAVERRTVGYTLEISTSLYRQGGEEEVRAYAATCVVNGDHRPLSFTMSETR